MFLVVCLWKCWQWRPQDSSAAKCLRLQTNCRIGWNKKVCFPCLQTIRSKNYEVGSRSYNLYTSRTRIKSLMFLFVLSDYMRKSKTNRKKKKMKRNISFFLGDSRRSPIHDISTDCYPIQVNTLQNITHQKSNLRKKQFKIIKY